MPDSRRTLETTLPWRGLIAAYGSELRITSTSNPITLCEGNTPLVPAPRLAAWMGLNGADLFLKFEGLNPTGSFKDRGMTTAITEAVTNGAHAVVCASTGNTAASAAAYAARAGLTCLVIIPDGKISLGKLAGAIAYGAEVVSIHGSFDDGLRLVRELSETSAIALVNSVNPARLEGQKTAAWEVADQLGSPPDWLCLPVGNAGNISAYWLGFTTLDKSLRRPHLLGSQAEGAAPIVLGHIVEHPETFATAIRIGNPARWKQAKEAIQASSGLINMVSDFEILETYQHIARLEGVFCEPSSATGVAGLKKAVQEERIETDGKTFVCVLTGHGLKDPDSALLHAPRPVQLPPTIEALRKHLKL